MSGYNTNLAAEFYVLSMLHRLGADAALTLGNKKAVDIFLARDGRKAATIDVKGVAKKYDWPADNIRLEGRYTHFLILVSFEGEIDNPAKVPSVWIVPSQDIARYIRQYKGRKVVSRADMTSRGKSTGTTGDSYLNKSPTS
jgi:hypothetical protein